MGVYMFMCFRATVRSNLDKMKCRWALTEVKRMARSKTYPFKIPGFCFCLNVERILFFLISFENKRHGRFICAKFLHGRGRCRLRSDVQQTFVKNHWELDKREFFGFFELRIDKHNLRIFIALRSQKS